MVEQHPASAYYEALGLFIHYFSKTEGLLLMGLQRLAGVDQLTAKAVMTGVKIDTAKSYINRLYEVRKKEKPAALERAFAQLTLINKTRNDIVHHGAEFNQNWLPVVSTSSQPMLGRERVHIVTPKILEAMSADLGTINYALSLSLFEAPNEEVRAAWQESADRPWLYKPV